MDIGLYSKVEGQKNAIVEKIKYNVQNYLIFIVLIFNIALEIVSQLYTIGFVNPFTIAFFLDLAISLTTTMITYICFIPFGVHQEHLNPIYEQNRKLWGKLTDAVRMAHNEEFRQFCHSQLEEERDDKRRLIIGNTTMIPFDIYNQKYKLYTKAELKEALKNQDISKIEYKAIKKANGYTLLNHIKVRPINPVIILSGVCSQNSINDAGRTSKSYALQWLSSRPIFIFIVNAILNSVSTTFTGSPQNAIFDMFISVLMIILASVFGYSAGVTSAKKDNDRVKSRIMFLSLFCEKNGVKTP
jgi:hypothetical protein